MPIDISPENERFIQDQIAAGVFQSRTDAIDAGVELLRRRKEPLDRIDLEHRQLEEDDYREYDVGKLQERFDQLRQRARGNTDVQQGS